MSHIHDDSGAPDDSQILQDVIRFLTEQPSREVDHYGDASAAVHRLREELEPLLTILLLALHNSRAVGAGKQWTILAGLTCGFRAELIIRVQALGPDHDADDGSGY